MRENPVVVEATDLTRAENVARRAACKSVVAMTDGIR
jgi:hypothetical protein